MFLFLFLFVLLSELLYPRVVSGLVLYKPLQTAALAELERRCGVSRTVHWMRRSILEGRDTRRRGNRSHISQQGEKRPFKRPCNQMTLQSRSIFLKSPWERQVVHAESSLHFNLFFFFFPKHGMKVLSSAIKAPLRFHLAFQPSSTDFPGVKEGWSASC